MNSPYEGLPGRAFWRQGVADRGADGLYELFSPKFAVGRGDRIVTAGSCFAQHVGRRLKAAGFNVLDAETAPAGVGEDVAMRFGYAMYSARYGNIYTTRQLRQLIDEAFGRTVPEHPVWERDGRFFDAQRPNVEPEGFDSPEDVLEARAAHLEVLRSLLAQADVFVFTFGLTEAWVSASGATVYPTAPGTIAGRHDPATIRFCNFTCAEVREDFLAVKAMLEAINPRIRFIVTVSPVPLTATAAGKHVEVATAYSKAVLRAAAGEIADAHANVDYFPSYEIITSQTTAGRFYERNLRSVTAEGVATAMAVFMQAQGVPTPLPQIASPPEAPAPEDDGADDAVMCEDALLEQFRT